MKYIRLFFFALCAFGAQSAQAQVVTRTVTTTTYGYDAPHPYYVQPAPASLFSINLGRPVYYRPYRVLAPAYGYRGYGYRGYGGHGYGGREERDEFHDPGQHGSHRGRW